MDAQTEAWINQLLAYVNSIPAEERDAYIVQACGERKDLLEAVQAARAAGGTGGKTGTGGGRSNAQMIGPYRILRELGKGGMGIVYLAIRDDGAFRKNVAIKLLRGDAVTAEFIERFRNERQVLANFDHPNIARILDGGDMPDGMPYYVMEYVEGRPFDRYCDEDKLSLNERLRLFQKLLSAIHYLHQNQVIHRDLKPSNVMVSNDGTVKLLDFGIAKQLGPASMELTTADGTPLTPAYASPEQFTGRADARSDIYTLGVILYLLLTGRLPDQGTSKPPSESVREDYQRTQETTKQLKKKLTGDLDAVVLKAMARESRQRYATAQEFSEDLDRFIAGLPVKALGGKGMKAWQGPVGIVAAILLVAGGGYFGVELWKQKQAGGGTTPVTQPAGDPGSFPTGGGTSGKPVESQPGEKKPEGGGTGQVAQPPVTTPGGGGTTKPGGAPSTAGNGSGSVMNPPTGGGSSRPPVIHDPGPGPVTGQGPIVGGPTGGGGTPPPPPVVKQPDGLDEARDKYSNIAAKVAASESLVNKVKADLEAKGLMIRGDTISRVTTMKLNLEQAKRDLDQGNVSGALQKMMAADALSSRINKEFGR